tara:strand:+ start:572 stop:739 length:168 start_codon:yes stop_codon:yes gene_type:complete
MNAKQYIFTKSAAKSYGVDSPLRFLSPAQKQKAKTLSKDWKSFTYGIYGDILDKL